MLDTNSGDEVNAALEGDTELADALAATHGVRPVPIQDPELGVVNAYPKAIWDLAI